MAETFKKEHLAAIKERFRYERVSSEEWYPGTCIYVYELSIKEQSQIETLITKCVKSKTNRKGESTVVSSNNSELNAEIALLCCRNEKNKPLFEKKDLPLLMESPQIVMSRIMDAYKRLNQVSEEDLEELEKNSATTPTYISAVTLP